MAWTDEKIERLKYLCSPECRVKLSATDLADDLGGVSRNAVIGKVRRLGLQLPQHWIELTLAETEAKVEAQRHRARMLRSASERRRREAGIKVQRYRKSATMTQPARAESVPDVDDLAIPLEQRRTIFELTDHTCRFPVGDPGTPGFFYCGGVPLEGHSYCPGHWRRTHDALRGFAKPFPRLSAAAAIAALLAIPPEAIPAAPVAA